MNTTSILDRFFEPVTQILSQEAAQKIVDLQLDLDLQKRLDELAERANAGTLTSAERDEYAGYVDELDLIAVFKEKARAALRREKP